MANFCNYINTNLVCESNYTDALFVCKFCGTGCVSDIIQCNSYELQECTYRQVLGLWAVFIIVFGILGNVLTLLAVPYAAKRKRHGLHKNWNNFTIFVMHLSVCDILYCTICLPFYASVYLGFPWVFGNFWCVGSIALAYIFAYVDWMALSLIALSRALSICAPTLLDKLSYGFKAKFSILFVWLFVILFMVPSFLEESVTFGYNCRRGKCDLFSTNHPTKLGWVGEQMPHFILTLLPTSIIIGSYTSIWIHLKISERKTEKNCTVLARRGSRREARNKKISWNMFVLCLCYTISSIPHTYYGYWAAQYDKASDQIFRISLGIFWLQYAFNVWIYAAQRDQYWNAYKDYIFENIIPGNKDRSNEIEENNNDNKLDSSTSNDNNEFRVDNQLPYR